jgi:hypothetical protein
MRKIFTWWPLLVTSFVLMGAAGTVAADEWFVLNEQTLRPPIRRGDQELGWSMGQGRQADQFSSKG